MKVIVAGSRKILDYGVVAAAIKRSGFDISEIVSGGAEGVDQLGELYALENNIPKRRYLPDYKKYGKKAPIMRNCKMGDYADALIAIWDGSSKGTKHMMDYMQKKNKKCHLVVIPVC